MQACLAIISVLVAFHCEFITDVIDDITRATGLSQAFIGWLSVPMIVVL